jgi:hypothetical protein
VPQNLDLTKRSRATQDEILEAFRDRLRDACPGCNDQTCFLSDQPIPSIIPAGGGHCITIAAGGGSYDQRLFSNGGHENLNEDFQVIISALVKINIDRIPQAERALLAEDRGLLAVWKLNLLRYLILADPDLGLESQHWEPAKDDRPLCRDLPRPLHCSEPADVPGHPGWIGFHLTFSVSFDWDLYLDG